MKKNTLPALLSAGCAIAGVLCMALRGWLLSAGVDAKGMLISFHGAGMVSWLLTAAVLVLLTAAVVRSSPWCRFAASGMTDLQSFLQAIALGILTIQLLSSGKNLSVITALAAIAAAVSCVAVPVLRTVGKPVHPIIRGVLVGFMLVFLIFRYQDWCREPALQRYGFELLAAVCLTLAAYQRLALEMNMGSSRTYLIAANAGVFFCLGAVPGTAWGIFYLLMAAATVLDGCTVQGKREAE